MAEVGKVVEIKDDLAVVKLKRTEACGKCRACAAGMQENEMIIEAFNKCDAVTGDWVSLEISNDKFFKAIQIMYGLPSISFISGVVICYLIFTHVIVLSENMASLASFIGGATLTALTYYIIKRNEKKWSSGEYRPRCVSVEDGPNEETQF